MSGNLKPAVSEYYERLRSTISNDMCPGTTTA
jgi:hypothetical protein